MARVVIATGDKYGTRQWERGILSAFSRRIKGNLAPLIIIHPSGPGVPGMIRDFASDTLGMREIEVAPHGSSQTEFAKELLDIGQAFETAGCSLEVLLFHSMLERSMFPRILGNIAIHRGITTILRSSPNRGEHRITAEVQPRNSRTRPRYSLGRAGMTPPRRS